MGPFSGLGILCQINFVMKTNKGLVIIFVSGKVNDTERDVPMTHILLLDVLYIF